MKKVKYILVATILMIQFINVSAITLDDIDFNSDNLAIGTFFSSKYDENVATSSLRHARENE